MRARLGFWAFLRGNKRPRGKQSRVFARLRVSWLTLQLRWRYQVLYSHFIRLI